MNRRRFNATGASAIFTAMLGASKSDAQVASLSVRATPDGPLVTPNEKFFSYSKFRYPETFPTTIRIDGLVDTPIQYSLDELSKIPPIRKLLTLECYVNTAGGALIFTTPFEGVPLSAVLDKIGVKPAAKSARIETADSNLYRLPLTELRRPETMLVSKLGNQPLPVRHGGSYTRLFVPGAGGNHHPKWVNRITFVEDSSPEHPAPPMAGFLSPMPPTVAATMSGVTLIGFAFAGAEKVGTVEISTDNGKTYRAMPLPSQPDPDVWITWELTFQPPQPGFYVLRVKATSASGRKQDFPGTIAVKAT
jgi:DMSO/TMAO reductase YedYZ molybdopterin-dependent catalytic subunit